jgi:hypothetical protein
MSSYSINYVGSDRIEVTITATGTYYFRIFCRLTSDTSSIVCDDWTAIASGNSYTHKITGLSASTSYTLNVGYNTTGDNAGVTWLGAKTQSTTSAATTYYYRAYDETNSAYLTSSTSTTSSSITRPTVSGYTYNGYKYNTSFTACINQSSYDGTGTTCSSHSASNPYVVFFYEPSSSSSSPWSWKSLGSDTDSVTMSLSLSAGQLGYINFTPSISGTLQVYTEGSIDTYGWLTNGSCSLSTGNGSSALTGGTVYTKDDDSGTDNNFSYSYEVTAGTSYEIDVHAYSSSTAVSGTTLYIVLTPPSYTITCKDRKYSSSGTLLSTTTVGTATYTSGSTAKGSDWGTTSSYTGYYYSSCTTISSVSAASTVYRNYYPNSYTVTYNLNGGEGSIANTSRYYNEAYTLTTSQPTKQFYNFLGWGTSTSSTTALAPGATIAASTSTSTITYYALWEEAIKPMYVGINGTPHRVTSIYIGVNGVPKNVTIGYSSISGVIKQIW